MKISVGQYAKILYEITANKTAGAMVGILKNFASLIIKNDDLKKADLIMEKFKSLWNHENKTVVAEVVSASQHDNNYNQEINSYIKKIANAEIAETKIKIDESILGGIIIKYNDRIIDNSLKTRLIELKEALQK
ncbi:ATP synthase F1 subunit delta [Candidatus Falkowbacteria bacterium CG_4_9_14_3_um_filter_36_9]|uniref:ATP synthase subunit delta n=1 Tax=Candidatus Falkowbacteria bacterium CG02_land_8_20_14_3_00_36_14 TaxID=1974560 RepID=A0A2M7DLT9_9BACT|nr:MAG: ATP synthase F1 subunit delta [Candidatus Falkowbacteria bacterium CG02_land_8_20_14_3_00_36_14]PIX11736.1 MAG: ATP synthase F1 subunit delta [Candidatus Falkowbacteria bacterium CG_4_8_14_3_um_filter_36_11]PJA11347.1 MAG: ATP synthase F1 subunit delta [Candidatus Falkowbacteria bacterium CG_4_10_14_0_2_um_filter_36_22]PJB19309.1 MAG: ATP synthase F1 subunit delta [Candidatus Falkowbacteria bacterium CG_4_9_14_3_um_filter_36_9]